MKRASSLVVAALAFAALGIAPSCTTDRTELDPASTSSISSTSTTDTRAQSELATLRRRFPSLASTLLRGAAASAPLARVELPSSSIGETVVEDVTSGVTVRIALADGARSPATRVDTEGLAVYPGAGIVVRAHAGGAEDLVSYESRPALEEAVYTINLAKTAGLRLVERALELLDESGTPRLRMNAPYVVDATGARIDTTVAVEGCAYDTSLAPPWGRPVTPPGASRCTLRLAWHGAAYPALLDPSWTVTGSAGPRGKETVVKLASGRVLMFYGESCGGGCLPLSSGVIYDPTTKTWAGTGSPQAKATDVPAVLLASGKVLALTPVGAQIYDPATGFFTDGPAEVVQRSGGATATRLASGKILCAGGGGASGSAELYDPATNTFAATPPMKAAHAAHAATLLASGKVLLTGGTSTSAEVYDPVTNAFTLTGAMAFARGSHDAIKLASGKVLVVGDAQQAELYDPATGVFTKTGSLAFARTHAASALVRSGNVYVAGGYIGSAGTTLVERYEPSTGLFSPAPTMVKVRGDLRLVLLDTSSLFAIGGHIDTNGTQSQDGGEELGVVAAGGACTIDDDCASGTCDLGVCCAAACTGQCMSCVAGTGACLPVKSADDPSSCTGASTCDANGACKQKRGRTCATDAECATGFCTDGVCCDRACKGACEACDSSGVGLCETVAGKPHGARTCATDGSSCGGACDGKEPLACAFPGIQTGCGTSCTSGVRTPRACDGLGACVPQPTRPCPGNYACADETSCRVTCAVDSECAHGYGCTDAKCVPIAACDGDHTVVSADGKSKTDCAPFRCDDTTNRCRTACEDVAGCTEPFLCDTSGQCVAPPSAPSGCAVSGGGTSSRTSSTAPFALASTIAALLFARRRRSRFPRCRGVRG